MVTQAEYAEYGKKAARSYIDEQVPLHDSLVKVAEDLQLNRHEIDRLVEEANTATYVKLFENTVEDDKYIEFPVAEAEKVAEAIEPKIVFSKVASFSEDYNSPPEEDGPTDDETIKAIFGNPESQEIEKTAEIIDHVSIDKKRALRTQMHELTYHFDDKSEQFIDFVKKAAFNGVDPDSLGAAIKTHVDSNIIDSLIDQAKQRINPSDSLDKVASLPETTGVVLLASELVSVAKKYVNLRGSQNDN